MTTTRSYLELLQAASTTFTLNWNTGQTSVVTGNRVGNIVGAAFVVVVTGTVSTGLFAGDSVVQTLTAPATDILRCTLGLGTVSSLYSTVELVITSV